MLFILVLVIIILFIIINFSPRNEYFKTEMIYDTNKYLNSPDKFLKAESYKLLTFKPYIKSDPTNKIFKPENVERTNKIDDGFKITNAISDNNINKKTDNKDNKLNELYADALFNFKPANKIINDDKPTVDQCIGTNIINYIDKGITSYYDEDNNKHKFNKIDITKRTIGEIYDDITNDGREKLQENLDNLEANEENETYLIDHKYGATRFDTYGVGIKNVMD